MTLTLNFTILLIGHLLGDFYFQTQKISDGKRKKQTTMILHGALYLLAVFAVLSASFHISKEMFFLGGFVSAGHFIFDMGKKYVIVQNRSNKKIVLWVKAKAFWIDQILHIATLIAGWWLWGNQLAAYAYIHKEYAAFPMHPLLIVLGLLLILRPAAIIIGEDHIWDFKGKLAAEGTSERDDENDSVKNAGKMIGYLERIIIFIFMILHQYTAIGFVLTAKSIARYEGIVKKRLTAEYYLIGTLLSAVFAIAVAFLLELC